MSLIQYFKTILPRICYLCRGTTTNNFNLCHPCCDELPWIKHACQYCAWPLAKSESITICGQCNAKRPQHYLMVAALSYVPPMNRIVTQLKFLSKLQLAHILGHLLSKAIQHQYIDDQLPELLIPIPLHKKRIQLRGFNQAAEITKPLKKQLAIPMSCNTLIRQRYTDPQTLIPTEQRGRNVKRAFKVNGKIKHSHVAIIDDVATTMHTVNEACQCLIRAGAKRVDIWCCCRALQKTNKKG